MTPQPQVFGGGATGLWKALKRGFARRCPYCGKGAIFRSYVAMNPCCPVCKLDFTGYHVDDAPPYFTILIVGHIIVLGVVLLEQFVAPPTWVQLALWLPLTLILTLLLLPKVKGALVGLHWANGIRD